MATAPTPRKCFPPTPCDTCPAHPARFTRCLTGSQIPYAEVAQTVFMIRRLGVCLVRQTSSIEHAFKSHRSCSVQRKLSQAIRNMSVVTTHPSLIKVSTDSEYADARPSLAPSWF